MFCIYDWNKQFPILFSMEAKMGDKEFDDPIQ